MKTIGLIGGMSWESTAVYYRLLNSMVRDRLGGLHSARLLLWSFDFAEIAALQAAGRWDVATGRMIEAARALQEAGADGLVICTNTMHRMADPVQDAVTIPLIHIADATAQALTGAGVKNPLLLATRFTMEQPFYKERLAAKAGCPIRVPDAAQREIVHQVIYDELCQGVINPASRAQYMAIIQQALAEGVDGVVLGCTEVGLLIRPEDLSVPCFDTTHIHAMAALDFALDRA